MKLIRKLPPIKDKKGRWISYAIFRCNGCKSEVERQLSNGLRAKSCGCNKGKDTKNNYKHGEISTRLYRIWANMKQRILNPNVINYSIYGGRGITICNEWLEFIPFRDWALSNGYNDTLEIDRKNTDGNYEPSNCHWVSSTENQRNKRNNVVTIEIANEIRYLHSIGKSTQKELAEKYDVNKQTIYTIINNKQWKN